MPTLRPRHLDMTQEFRQLMVDLMTERDLSDRHLAKLAGVSDTSIARIRRGERIPTLDMVQRILAGLGYDVKLEVTPR